MLKIETQLKTLIWPKLLTKRNNWPIRLKSFTETIKICLSFLFAENRSLPIDDESSLSADRKKICLQKFRKWKRWNTDLEIRHYLFIVVSILFMLREAKMWQCNMIEIGTFPVPTLKELRFFFIPCLKGKSR